MGINGDKAELARKNDDEDDAEGILINVDAEDNSTDVDFGLIDADEFSFNEELLDCCCCW